MAYILHKSCIIRKSISDMYFNTQLRLDSLMCQIFITANIIVIFHNDKHFIYYKKSFRTRTSDQFFDQECAQKCCGPNYYLLHISNVQSNKNIHIFARDKLNYSRIFKDVTYKKYIDFMILIENIIERLFV